MTDYTELVKALRGKFIAYDVTGNHNSARLYKDAADAIEKLITLYEKAEIDATNLTGKLAQAEAQLPKRGEWIMDGKYSRHCSICNESVAWPEKYCPNCGAKMIGEQNVE